MANETTKENSVLIYGGCVSRDTIEFAEKGSVQISRYIARSSLLSGGTNAASNLPRVTLESSFQERMVRIDVHGQLFKAVKNSRQVDQMFWDLNVERNGIYLFEDGSVVTKSPELMKVQGIENTVESARFLDFATEEFFYRWKGAATVFVSFLDSWGMKDKTVVLAPQWAETDELGEPTGSISGLRARDFNDIFNLYFDHLEHLGVQVVRLNNTVANSRHKWGKAPFHYMDDVYCQLLEKSLVKK